MTITFRPPAEEDLSPLARWMVRSFVDPVFADQEVGRIQADAAPGIVRSVRCPELEKVGFTHLDRGTTSDGPAALTMLERRNRAGGRKPDEASAGSVSETGVDP